MQNETSECVVVCMQLASSVKLEIFRLKSKGLAIFVYNVLLITVFFFRHLFSLVAIFHINPVSYHFPHPFFFFLATELGLIFLSFLHPFLESSDISLNRVV